MSFGFWGFFSTYYMGVSEIRGYHFPHIIWVFPKLGGTMLRMARPKQTDHCGNFAWRKELPFGKLGLPCQL